MSAPNANTGVAAQVTAAAKAPTPEPIRPAVRAGGSKSDFKASPAVKMVAGSLGGFMEALCCQPLDVAKTRLQLDKKGKYKGMVNTIKTVYAEEGFRALYKGLSPFVTHLTIKYALRLGAFGAMQNALAKTNDGKTSPLRTLFAGTFAGATEAVLIVTPFEVVKTRLQQQKGLDKANAKYKGPIHCAATIVKEEGVGSLWKGVTPTVIRQASNQAFNFFTLGLINNYVWGKFEGDGQVLPLWKSAITGLAAGAVGPCFNQPFDVAKSRMMAQKEVGAARKYTSTLQCITTIVREEGFKAAYKGFAPRISRVAPGQMIMWTTVLRIEGLFERRQKQAAADAGKPAAAAAAPAAAK